MYVKGLKRVLAKVDSILSTHAKINFNECDERITVHTYGVMIDFDSFGNHIITRHYVESDEGVQVMTTLGETIEETRIRLTMNGIIRKG